MRFSMTGFGLIIMSGVALADTTSEQNSNMGECWCTPCGKFVSCQSMEKDPAVPVSQDLPAKRAPKSSEKAE